jgi:hypothetical protein
MSAVYQTPLEADRIVWIRGPDKKCCGEQVAAGVYSGLR